MKMTIFWHLKGLVAVASGFLEWYLGGYDGLLKTLIALSVVNYIASVICAFVRKEPFGEIAKKVFAKKVFIFMLVGLGHLLDIYLLASGNTLRTALIIWYIKNERKILVENAVILDVPVPDILKNFLAQIRSRGGNDMKHDNSGNKDRDGKDL